MGAGYDRYDTTLRRAEIHDRGLVLFCDDENHRDGDSDPIVEVEVRCDSFSLSASGIGLSDGVHDFAKGLLCPRTRQPQIASRILWRSASDYRQGPIRFLTAGDRLTVAIDPFLGFPTHEQEEARYHLETCLSYEREVRRPPEMEHLLKDVRGRLTQEGSCTLEQRLWGAAGSINFIHSPTLRMAMTQALKNLGRPALEASRPVRDAICLHDIFLHPPQALSEQDYGELSHQRQQNEGNLIQLVQNLWSVMRKSVNTAVPYEAESFRRFMLHVLALLQFFPARLPKTQDVGHYSLTIVEHGVCLNFDASQETVEFKWPDLERAFRTKGLARLLGLNFDSLPDIFAHMPPFEGLGERISPSPPQERCYSGRVMSDVDLYMLCKDFGNLPTVPPPPASNYVLIRPLRRYDVDRDWVYQESSYPFTVYSRFGDHGQSVRSIKIAKYNLGYQWFFFMAVILDEKGGTTPCQDPGILQLSQVLPQLPLMVYHSNKKQNRFVSLLSGLDHLVQELHSISSDCNILPENLKNLLPKACALVQSHLAQERLPNDVVDEGTQLDLELHCRLVVQCCAFIGGHLRPGHDHYRLRTALSQLKWHAEGARHTCAPFIGKDFGLEPRTACESRDDRGSLPPQENTSEEPFPIPNTVSMDSAPSSRSVPSLAIGGVGFFPCTFGSAGTKVKLFNECKVASDTECDWKRHDQLQHEQPDQWICPEAACRMSFFHESTHLEHHLRKDHGKTGDLTEEVSQWHVRRNHQRSFFCPSCDKVIHHSLTDVAAIRERFRHLVVHIRPERSDADMVWIERESKRTHSGMEMEIVQNE